MGLFYHPPQGYTKLTQNWPKKGLTGFSLVPTLGAKEGEAMQKWFFTILSALCVGWGVWLMVYALWDPGPIGQFAAILLALAVIFRGAAEK